MVGNLTAVSSTGPEYAARLDRLSSARWKRLIPNPYGWLVRRIATGRVLDVGCGIGRCLGFLDGRGVGIDPNEAAIALCRERGYTAFTPEEFALDDRGLFDTMLCAHVVEHLTADEASGLMQLYASMVRPGGRVVLIVPQQRGFRSDATHVRFVGATELGELARESGLIVKSMRSFPLPRWAGGFFVYNETVLVARRP